MLSAILVGLSFAFQNDAVVAVLRLGAGAPLAVALVLAVIRRTRKTQGTMADRVTTGATVVGAFVAGALVFSYITSAQDSSPDSPAFDINVSESVATLPVSRLEVDVTEEQTERVLDDAEAAISALEVVDGQRAGQLIAAAQDVQYEPRVARELD